MNFHIDWLSWGGVGYLGGAITVIRDNRWRPCHKSVDTVPSPQQVFSNSPITANTYTVLQKHPSLSLSLALNFPEKNQSQRYTQSLFFLITWTRYIFADPQPRQKSCMKYCVLPLFSLHMRGKETKLATVQGLKRARQLQSAWGHGWQSNICDDISVFKHGG